MANLVIKSGKGFSKEEARENVGFPFEAKFDATQAYKKAQKELDFNLKTFAREHVNKKVKGASNVGFVIVVDPAVEDVRTRPYKEEVIATDGKRKYKTQYQVFTVADNRLLGSADKKDEASKLAKTLMSEDVKEDLEIRLAKVVVEGQPIAAKLTYAPTKGAKEGSYIFFGLETE